MSQGLPDVDMTTVDFVLNGEPRRIELEARRTLADVLREDFGLTGTHLGCEHGVCGACTVLLDGRSVRACITLAVQAQDREVTTIEGLSSEDDLSPLQQAMSQRGGLQCGFCTPGIVVAATELLRDSSTLDEEAVRSALSGNLCRCTGYEGIVDAILSQEPGVLEAPHVTTPAPTAEDRGTGLEIPPTGPVRPTWRPQEPAPHPAVPDEGGDEYRWRPFRRGALALGLVLGVAAIVAWRRRHLG